MACAEMQPRAPAPVPADRRMGAAARARGAAAPQVYLPALRRAPALTSPDYVQISTAAAITLGIVPGRMHRCACTRCLNLLLTYPEGCRANCAYCGLARHREATRDYADRNFIRVDWPAVPLDALIARVADPATPFHRMCISMITHPRSDADTLTVLRRWTARIPRAHVPVSILSNPTTMTRDDVQALHDAGADIFTVALDACTEAIFARTRGRGVQSPHDWHHYWRVFDWAAEIFGPERVGMHLIAGMGETERDVLEVIARLRAAGGHSHMFAFFPERGSLMDHLPAVDRGAWRRVQLARYLMDYRGATLDRFAFDAEGRITGLGIEDAERDALVASGIPFRTSGCPGKEREDVSACDRPYGDSPPSDIASFPFAPAARDIARIRRQLA